MMSATCYSTVLIAEARSSAVALGTQAESAPGTAPSGIVMIGEKGIAIHKATALVNAIPKSIDG